VFLVSKTEQGGLSLPKARFAAKCRNIRKRAIERQARAEVAPVKADRAACAIPPRATAEDRSPRRAQWSLRRRVAQLPRLVQACGGGRYSASPVFGRAVGLFSLLARSTAWTSTRITCYAAGGGGSICALKKLDTSLETD
jgi:hypothetical protein